MVGRGNQVSRGILFTQLTDWAERDRTAQEIIEDIQPQFFGDPRRLGVRQQPAGVRRFGQPVQFVVRHPDFDAAGAGHGHAGDAGPPDPRADQRRHRLRVNKPELTVSFDRDRAEDLGVPVRDVATTLQALLGGQRVSTFTRDNKLYDVIVQLRPKPAPRPSDMSGLYAPGPQRPAGPAGRDRPRQRGRRPAAAQPLRSGAVLHALGQPRAGLHARRSDRLAATRSATRSSPPAAASGFAGESRELEESGGALYFAFVLALIVVFMVLASQFESLVHPFTVLLAVPLAVTGAIFTLKLTGSTLNLYSQIGMILLIGLVTKNSILLVEYPISCGSAGMDDARSRAGIGADPAPPHSHDLGRAPIMGALPIALGLGAGSMSAGRPLGYAIVGGVLFSTVLTLFLVPVAYVLLDRLQRTRLHAAHEPSRAERRPGGGGR